MICKFVTIDTLSHSAELPQDIQNLGRIEKKGSEMLMNQGY